MVISAALGFAAGIGITLLLQRRRRVLASKRTSKRTSKDRSIVLNAPQLLAWIDAATQGWMILAPDHSIAYINLSYAGTLIGVTLFIGCCLQIFGFASGAALLVALLLSLLTGGALFSQLERLMQQVEEGKFKAVDFDNFDEFF